MTIASKHALFVAAIVLAPFISVVQSFQPPVNLVSISIGRLQPKSDIHRRCTTKLHQSTPSKVSTTNSQPSSANKNNKRKKRKPSSSSSRSKKRKRTKEELKPVKNPNEIETWRIYGVDINPDDLGPSAGNKRRVKDNNSDTLPPELSYLTPPVLSALLSRLRIKSDIGIISSTTAADGETASVNAADDEDIIDADTTHSKRITLPSQLQDVRVVRRSLDARRRRGSDPKFMYVIDVSLTKKSARDLRFVHQPGRMERLSSDDGGKSIAADNKQSTKGGLNEEDDGGDLDSRPKIIIVGAGPAGLFCALSLAQSGLFRPILLERGQPVSMRYIFFSLACTFTINPPYHYVYHCYTHHHHDVLQVEARGKSIGALIHRREIDPESNFSFGEGGAGKE